MDSCAARMMCSRLGAPGDAQDGAPGVHIPVGRAQAGEGGHHIDARRCRSPSGRNTPLSAALGEEAASRPAATGSPRRPRRRCPPAHSCTLPFRPTAMVVMQAVFALDRCCLAGVHQQEAAGAVGVLGIAPAQSRSGRTGPPAGRPAMPAMGTFGPAGCSA